MGSLSAADLAAALEAIELKAAADPKFKRLALLQPRAALQKISGAEVPPGPLLTIIDFDLTWDTASVVPPLSRAQRRRVELQELAALFESQSDLAEG